MDGRIRVARLTAEGVAERAVLDERSDELAGSILDPLDEGQRAELVGTSRSAAARSSITPMARPTSSACGSPKLREDWESAVGC